MPQHGKRFEIIRLQYLCRYNDTLWRLRDVFVILRVKIGTIQNSVMGDAIEPLNWRFYRNAVPISLR